MNKLTDYELLSSKFGFGVTEIEKVCRITNVLESISQVKFLRDRLSLYGGTALAFIYFGKISRLSVDLDFNYRHKDDVDWGEIRDEIDIRIKKILYQHGYNKSQVKVDPSYPLSRIVVQYANTNNIKDSFNIEIGYLRRIPILKSDTIADFTNICNQQCFSIKTPIKEELFANKWCTLLYRKSPRDLFDVSQIIELYFDKTIFRKCAIIDSLMRTPPKLYCINFDYLINNIPIDTRLTNLLRERISKVKLDAMKSKVIQFSKSVISSLTLEEINAIDIFYETRKFHPELIDDAGILHEQISRHPLLLRMTQLKS